MTYMEKATKEASHNLKFYYDEFDEDDFQSDDNDTVDFHPYEFW